MSVETPRQRSILLVRFREFYREVARLRELVAMPGVTTGVEDTRAMAAAAAPAGTAGGFERSGVWQQLLTQLERQATEAGQTGGAFAYEVYREAQYVMAALADDIFLNMDWDGRRSWSLLETRLFGSHMAGETIFRRIDVLLQRRDPYYVDLASVYFMALSLGFQGKYRGMEDLGPLVQYRRQLFAMIYARHPKLFSEDMRLFPHAYQNTMDKGEGKKLPDQRVWLALVGLVLLAWLGITQIAWASLSSPLESGICSITKTCAGGTK
jgi:type VI secretion system protein ImpK